MSGAPPAAWRVRQVKGLGPLVVDARGKPIATVHAGVHAPMMACAPSMLEALRRIERNTRGYDSMCTMGILHEIALAAINEAEAPS
jgi:hypothetical protein